MTHTLITQIEENLGLGALPQKVRRARIAQLGQLVMEGVMVSVLERLTPEEREEFKAMGTRGEYRRMLLWLESHVPDFSELIESQAKTVIEALREEEGSDKM